MSSNILDGRLTSIYLLATNDGESPSRLLKLFSDRGKINSYVLVEKFIDFSGVRAVFTDCLPISNQFFKGG
jgi:hypothetical protein